MSGKRPPRKEGVVHEGKAGKVDTGQTGRLGAKLLLLVGSIAFSLVLCEVLVRAIGVAPGIIPIGVTSDKHVYRRSTNPILSYEFKPGFRSDAEDLPHDYRVINSHGMRDVERRCAKPPGTKRIILLGDSVVVGYRIEEIDQLMSRQLEMLYRDRKVEVLNMSVTGYCTRAEVELLRLKGVKYDPDAVILVFVENDFRNHNPESIGASGIEGRPACANWLFRNSHLFRLACLRLNWFSFGLEADPARWNDEAIGDNNVPEGLALLARLAKEHGFKPLVAVWPAFKDDGIVYPPKMFIPDSDELIVERLAESHGLPVVGLRDRFREDWLLRTPRRNPRKTYSIGDGMHASVEGHRVAARIFHRVIDETGLLEPAGGRAARSGVVVKRDISEARRAARALGSEKAGYGMFYINRAVALHKQGRLEEALAELRKVRPQDKRNYCDASVAIASILRDLDRNEKARARLEKALRMKPDHFECRMLLAMTWTEQEAYDKAIEHLKHAVQTRPGDHHGRYLLGATLAKCHRWKEAESHLRAALRQNPRSKPAARQLARCLRRLGRDPSGR